ncbi:MAG: S-layer family protein, partial [Acinetobacter sp.]
SAGADIQIQTYGLNNDAGLIQSGKNLNVDSLNQNLSNQQSGTAGGLIAQKGLSIQNVKQLNNQQGFIGANESVEISAQQLQNQKGQISSAEDVNVAVLGEINNQEGQITAQGNISLQATTVDNTAVSSAGSQIIAGKDLQIATSQLINSNTLSTAGQGINAENIQIGVQSLKNHQGAGRAKSSAILNVEQQLNNAQGLISTVNQLQLQSNSQQLMINNKQGQMLTGQQLQIDAEQLSGDGQVISLGNADITLTETYQHSKDAMLQANGQLNLTLQQDLDNLGKITAGEALNIQANNIRNLTADASLQAQKTVLNAGNSIYNAGLINGGLTVLKAMQIDNEGTGRIYGSALALQADILNNRPDIAGTAPVIAARERLDIGVNSLNNLANPADYDSQALIFSAGDFYLGGALDQNNQAAGVAQIVNNAGARIEALGNLYFSARQVNNSNANFDAGLVLVSTNKGQVKEFKGGWKTFDGLYFGGNPSEDWTVYRYDIEYSETQVKTSAPGLIQAGGSLKFDNTDSIVNDKSQILAGQLLEVNGISADQSAVLNNTGVDGLTKVLYTGTQELHYLDGGDHDHEIDYHVWRQESLGSEPLPVSIAKPFQNIAPSSATIDQVQADALDIKIDQADSAATTPKDQIDLGSAAGTDTEIRAVDNSQFKVPNSALYKVNKDSNAQYLIETDPAFANYKNWLSSDYMLNALGLDPSMQQKRLGDGYYEQRMVQDQIAQLTGHRFLDGYGSDEEQYKALMNNSLSFAKLYGLRPGIALTAAQIAQLTSDIVWLEEKEVTLPNGSKQKALVPQVYVKARVGDLKGDGTLISAETVKINMQGDVLNSAIIAGRNAVVLNADNVNQLNGRIQANDITVKTVKDLNIEGGQIVADYAMQLDVGRDFKLNTTTLSSEHQIGDSYFKQTGIDRVAGLYINSPLKTQSTDTENLKTTISIRVGGNTQMKGAEIANNSGSTLIQTVGDVDVGAVTTEKISHTQNRTNNYGHLEQRETIGTKISSLGDSTITGQNITGQAVSISSQQGNVELFAEKNIQLESGLQQQTLSSKTEGKGSFSGKKSSEYIDQESISKANQLNAGKNIIIHSQQGNITATHLQAEAGNTIQIQADKG